MKSTPIEKRPKRNDIYIYIYILSVYLFRWNACERFVYVWLIINRIRTKKEKKEKEIIISALNESKEKKKDYKTKRIRSKQKSTDLLEKWKKVIWNYCGNDSSASGIIYIYILGISTHHILHNTWNHHVIRIEFRLQQVL